MVITIILNYFNMMMRLKNFMWISIGHMMCILILKEIIFHNIFLIIVRVNLQILSRLENMYSLLKISSEMCWNYCYKRVYCYLLNPVVMI